jgi:diacylglycerol O-acyltransferase
VFGRRAREIDGVWMWEDDPDFSLQRHLRRVTLPAPGGHAEAQAYVSSRFSDQFDPNHPLWEMDFISGVHDVSDRDGAMVLARFHHGIADGVRLVQVLLSMLDPLSDEVVPSNVGRAGLRGGVLDDSVRVVKSTVRGTADFLGGAASTLVRSPAWISSLRPASVTTGLSRLRRPTVLTDSLSEMASEDNTLVNTWRSLARLSLSGRSVDTVWSGTPGVAKNVSWITGVPLAEVRRIGHAHGATVNDVLLSAVSLALTDYLAEHGETNVDELNWFVPVSLAPITAEPPKELGNKFAVVIVPMPIGITDPHRLLRTMRGRMNRIKRSTEPAIVYGIQRTVAEIPEPLAVALTNYVANKCVGLLTNVPGPRAPMALAGTEVVGILGFGPPSGDNPLGICIFSYNGTVSFGIGADATLVPDPGSLADHIAKAIQTLGEHTDRTAAARAAEPATATA